MQNHKTISLCFCTPEERRGNGLQSVAILSGIIFHHLVWYVIEATLRNSEWERFIASIRVTSYLSYFSTLSRDILSITIRQIHMTSAQVTSLIAFTEILFPELKAWKNSGPTTITITWDTPPNHVLSELTHYHVTYTQISDMGAAVVNLTSNERNVTIDSLYVTLNDLATYSTYKIVVRPVLSNGKLEELKVLFAGGV